MLFLHLLIVFVHFLNFADASITFGTKSVFAGSGVNGNSGDTTPATSATLGHPSSLWGDSNSNIYIADPLYHVIRKVDGSGIISTYAGSGNPTYQGTQLEENVQATSANLNKPRGIWGNTAYLFIADTDNFRVRQVNLGTGIISTLAGNGVQGLSSSELFNPFAGYYDPVNGINYVTDMHGCVIRSIAGNPATLTTIAGTLRDCSSAHHTSLASVGLIGKVYGLNGDGNGYLYFPEYYGWGVQELEPVQQQIKTFFYFTNGPSSQYSMTSVWNDHAGHFFVTLVNDGSFGVDVIGYDTSDSAQSTYSINSGTKDWLKAIWGNAASKTLYIADAKLHQVYKLTYTTA